jgi:hypothetical protein
MGAGFKNDLGSTFGVHEDSAFPEDHSTHSLSGRTERHFLDHGSRVSHFFDVFTATCDELQ